MKVVKKFRLSSKQRLLAILLAALILMSIAAAVAVPLMNSTDEPEKKDPPEILDGEAIYLNTAVAYPVVSEASIQYIMVKNVNGTFDMLREDGGGFWIRYGTGDGESTLIPYVPPISSAEGNYSTFDYSSLYAIEGGDGFGRVYMLTYLCSAIGTPYFTERIPLPKVKSEREALLKEYGFDKSVTETVRFAYTEKNSEGKEEYKNHTLTIGGKAVSDSGFYFMVDDRDYVYYTTSSYFEYALRGVHSFIKGTLVAAGIPSDSAYEPYLTTDFRQWVNEKHKEEGESVLPGSNVVITGETIVPLNEGADYVSPEGARTDGYRQSDFGALNFDLEKFKLHPDFERISSILTSLKVGKCDEKKIITLIVEDGAAASKLIDPEKTSYRYFVNYIESVITDTDEIETEGYPVADARLIKVAYYYTVDGKDATSLVRHAVLDLSDEAIPESARAALRASSVGPLTEPISFDIEYSLDNAVVAKENLVVTEINKIIDKNGDNATVVSEDSKVSIKYYKLVAGNRIDFTEQFDLTAESNTEEQKKIAAAIIGRGLGTGLEIKVYENTALYEIFRDFTAYRVESVDYFVTSELVVAFSFVNASDRDPYYGESFYENKLDSEYRFYGLNASACENVVKFLGGVGDEGTSSAGFSGETVAIGLNHATLEKYGLYAYKIYFELPRHITDITEGTEDDGDDTLSDYSWLGTLGFTLHISEKNYDPDTGAAFRYVGSDMYNLVAKVYGEELDFLEYSFTEFYARPNMVLTSITEIENMEVSFNMNDLKGKYNFEVQHRDFYLGYEGDKTVAGFEYFEGATKTEKLFVYISASGERIDTEFEKLLASSPDGKVSVTNIYNVVNNDGKPMHESIVDTVGVSNFKSAYELLMLTRYQGTLTEEERELARSGEPVMTLRLKMKSSAYYYTYDFYRFDDRRVMVSLYQSDSSGKPVSMQVSDFYITTFALKKLCASYVNLLNGVYIDRDAGYTEIPISR